MTRKPVSADVQLQVLIEAGYRCGVPTCRTILAIDMHHIVEVSEGGGNEPGNLLALCPTCHALFHRGTIRREATFAWKSVLVSLTQAFDREAIDLLLFLEKSRDRPLLELDANGVLRFSRLIAADLADYGDLKTDASESGWGARYSIRLTSKGDALIAAWKKGDRTALATALAPQDSGV